MTTLADQAKDWAHLRGCSEEAAQQQLLEMLRTGGIEAVADVLVRTFNGRPESMERCVLDCHHWKLSVFDWNAGVLKRDSKLSLPLPRFAPSVLDKIEFIKAEGISLCNPTHAFYVLQEGSKLHDRLALISAGRNAKPRVSRDFKKPGPQSVKKDHVREWLRAHPGRLDANLDALVAEMNADLAKSGRAGVGRTTVQNCVSELRTYLRTKNV